MAEEVGKWIGIKAKTKLILLSHRGREKSKKRVKAICELYIGKPKLLKSCGIMG